MRRPLSASPAGERRAAYPGPFGTESALRDYGLRLAEDGTAKAKKRAVVAVARKLAVLLLTLWKSRQPLRTFSTMA